MPRIVLIDDVDDGPEEREKLQKILSAAIEKCSCAGPERQAEIRCALVDIDRAIAGVAAAHRLSALETVFVTALVWDDVLEQAQRRLEAATAARKRGMEPSQKNQHPVVSGGVTMTREKEKLAAIYIASDIGGEA